MVRRRPETTLFDLVEDLSDVLRDDERTVRLVTQRIRRGCVRTSMGRAVRLSPGPASDFLPGSRRRAQLLQSPASERA